MSGLEGAVRPFSADRDLAAIERVWREVGWVSDDDEAKLVAPFHEAGRALVFEIDGAAESSVHVAPGTMRYLDTDLRLAAVTAVTTSHVARRRGAAKRLLAQMLAEDAETGSHVAALGMFEQGFYDLVGFGSMPYEQEFRFDPRSLTIDVTPRPPVRVTAEDWQDVHTCMTRRRRGHGAVTLDDAVLLKAELGWHDPAFGLGYRDDDGALTHFVFGSAKGEHGPYQVEWIGYRDVDDLFELLALVRTLGDQVDEVVMGEPPELQLQDLLRTPFRERRRTTKRTVHDAASWQQVRVLDLVANVRAARLGTEPLRCNLVLRDPVEDHLPDEARWRGLSGEYVLTLGPESDVEVGRSAELPTLQASIGPFSRVLWGVRPASVLANSTDLTAPPDLLTALDRALATVPTPRFAWDF